MSVRRPLITFLAVAVLGAFPASGGEAQALQGIEKTVKTAAESERREAVAAVTDPAQAPAQGDEKPGTGAWANYDFVPGERVLFVDDFTADNVGDFPRRMTLVKGNWEVVEWQGRRLLRVMVDGQYAKVFVNERRVANVPNAQLTRGSVIHLENAYFADEKNPMYFGTIRVAAGGRDLYDVLEAEGRVAVQGIYFATDSDRIRPESTPTLKGIGEMLKAHADLRLSIEGHTDSDGEEAYNQQLSERRAAAVKSYLVETFAIDPGRVETAGHGEGKPVADNATPEGKQQNRRVELVKLGG